MQSQTNCPDCNLGLLDMEIEDHIRSCDKYSKFHLSKINRFSKDTPSPVLKFLKAELKISLEYLDTLLYKGRAGLASQLPASGQLPPDLLAKKSSARSSSDSGMYDNSDATACLKCSTKIYDTRMLFYVEQCWHSFCLDCTKDYIQRLFVKEGGSLKCLREDCLTRINQNSIKEILGNEKFKAMTSEIDQQLYGSYKLVTCASCKEIFDFVEGNFHDAPKKDNNGKPLAEQYAHDYANNRFVCRCKTEQCRICHATPYHLGMNCKEFSDNALIKKCRYCDEPLPANKSYIKVQALADICPQKSCQDLSLGACKKILPCNHPCYGYCKQKVCLPCLHEDCVKRSPELKGVKGDDYCQICFIEGLSFAPCVRSKCGHIFHVKCLKKRFQIRWLTPRIMFSFCKCPLCNDWIQVQKECELDEYVTKNKQLHVQISKMSLQRLKFEELEKSDEKLKDKASPYFGKPQEYAMAIYAYFMCFKCQKPYFGGRKNCAQAMNAEPAGGKPGGYNEKDLVCPNCCDIPIENCPKHGKDFIEFKCKFCCSIAQWFCWGNTHFCEPCHNKQCNGEYVSKYTKEQLPKCQGPAKCPVGGNHNGNGQEKMLGCAICRNYKQNKKDY